MNGKSVFRWFLITAFTGFGICVLIAVVWPVVLEIVWAIFSAPAFGIGDFVLLGIIGLCISAVSFHWASLLFTRRYHEFGAVVSCVVAMFVALGLMALPYWTEAFQNWEAWWMSNDRPPLGTFVGLLLRLAWLIVPLAAARWVYRGGQSWVMRITGNPTDSRRLLR
jgi:hypothetical protein